MVTKEEQECKLTVGSFVLLQLEFFLIIVQPLQQTIIANASQKGSVIPL